MDRRPLAWTARRSIASGPISPQDRRSLTVPGPNGSGGGGRGLGAGRPMTMGNHHRPCFGSSMRTTPSTPAIRFASRRTTRASQSCRAGGARRSRRRSPPFRGTGSERGHDGHIASASIASSSPGHGGIVTATEGAALAVAAALFIGGAIYRELNWPQHLCS